MSKAMQLKLIAALKKTCEKFPDTEQIVQISTGDLAKLLDGEAGDERMESFIQSLEESHAEMASKRKEHLHAIHNVDAGDQFVDTTKMPAIPTAEEARENQLNALKLLDEYYVVYRKAAEAFYLDRDNEDLHDAMHDAEGKMYEAVETVSMVAHPHTPESLARTLKEMGIMQNGEQPVH